MKTKKVKRRRLNFARTLVFILFIYLIVCLCIYIYKEPVRHFAISGNSILKDVDILRDLNLMEYPSYVSINTKHIKKELESNPLIKSAKVKYGLNFQITIEIEENKPMFLVKSTDKIVLSDGTMIDNQNQFVGLPTLLNATPENLIKLLAENLYKVNEGILWMISEIEYQPSYNSQNQPIDENRFLLSMVDKNLVYITAKKADLLNHYLDITAAEPITGTGTLYLDSQVGNYTFNMFDPTKPIEPTTIPEEPVEGGTE